MRSWENLLILLLITFLVSCNFEKREVNTPSKKEGNARLSKFDKTIKQVHDIDSLYYLTDKFEQRLLKEKVPQKILADFYRKAAGKYYAHSKYEISKEYFIKAERAYMQAADTLMSIKMKGNQAVLLDLQGHYKDAIEVLLEVSGYFQKINDTLPLAFAYSNIGVIYEELNNPSKAIYYGKMALELKRKAGDTLHMATNLNNIGVNFDELLNNPDSAIYYYQQALEIYKHYRKDDNYATVLNNLGRMFLEKEAYNKAAQNFTEAYHIFDSLNSAIDKAAVLRNQGELCFYQGKIKPALKKMQKAYNLYKLTGATKGLVETTELLSKIYMADGNYGEATTMMQQYNSLKDTLLNSENQAVIAELETKYQVKEKDKTIHLLKLQDQLHTKQIRLQMLFIGFMVVVVILLAFVFILFSKRTNLQQQELRLELQNYLLRFNEVQNQLKNKKEDCREKTGFNKPEAFNLSKQELKVLRLIAEGYKNAEIAEQLFISQNTVKTHIKNIYSKLDVKNRVEALKKINGN